MIGWHEDGDDINALKAHERALGKRFAIVRTYHQWQLPGRRVDQLVSEGRLPLGQARWRRIARARSLPRGCRSVAPTSCGHDATVFSRPPDF